MARKKTRQKSRQYYRTISNDRDLETVRAVNKLLDEPTVNTKELRRVAAIRGLAKNEVRSRVWPILLGVQTETVDPDEYDRLCTGTHRDSSVVKCDVVRSLWSFTEGWSDEDRDTKRQALARILTASVCSFPEDVFYYQGLHDIASVLLFVVGEKQAFLLLRHLVKYNLRDSTRSTMEPVMELLSLMLPILEQCDAELAHCLYRLSLPPMFALGWLITLFAHSIPCSSSLARLFDLFLSSHPLMPLYCGAVVMKVSRSRILRHAHDAAEMHSLLMKLPILDELTPDSLAEAAVKLFKRAHPTKLIRMYRIRISCAVAQEARLESDVWRVPDQPTFSGHDLNPVAHQLWSLWHAVHHHSTNPRSVAAVSSVITLYVALMVIKNADWWSRWM